MRDMCTWEKEQITSMESVFTKGEQIYVKPETIVNALAGLESTLEIYRSSINRKYDEKKHSGYADYEYAKSNGIIPLWYSLTQDKLTHNSKLSLSLAAIGRKSYDKKMDEFAGKTCRGRDKACPACRLFGLVGKEEGEYGAGSRVRFTDATLDLSQDESDDLFINETLKELGMPRNSYLPFYTENGKDYDNQNVQIQGRKYYWHNSKVNEDESIYSTIEKNNRNATHQVLKKDHLFTFKVYFDGITKEEFKTLKWVLCLGENDIEGNLCHKLGHGKPLGLGSVIIKIEEEFIRTFSDFQYKTSQNRDVKCDKTWNNADTINMLKVISNFKAIENTDICYPYVGISKKIKKEDIKINEYASHRWFSENQTKEEKKQLLPKLSDCLSGQKFNEEKMRLKPYILDSLDKKGKGKAINKSAEIVSISHLQMDVSNKYVKGRTDDGRIVSVYANGNIYKNSDTIKVKLSKYNKEFKCYNGKILS